MVYRKLVAFMRGSTPRGRLANPPAHVYLSGSCRPEPNRPPTVVDPQLLEILVCPESKQPIREAEASLVARINAAIAAGAARNRVGEVVRDPVDGGLIRQDGNVFYPVREGIPIMLIDESLTLADLA